MSNVESLNNALLRADLWRVLALAFNSPTTQSLADLEALTEDLASALKHENSTLREGLGELVRGIKAQGPDELEHEFNALFSMDVMVPAYEGSYQRIERGTVVGDVSGYYKAFGLSTVDNSGPPDSLWNELAFLCWLSLKEGYAIEQEMEESLCITRDAMREFLQDHLGRWVGAFSHRLLATTETPFYVTATHLLLAAVSRAADELNIGEIDALEVSGQSEEPNAVACPMGGRCS
jgi:TorA maturation chaperone TorD